jgi:hypothetical protein
MILVLEHKILVERRWKTYETYKPSGCILGKRERKGLIIIIKN